jgi:HK97 gp10 family phage protein
MLNLKATIEGVSELKKAFSKSPDIISDNMADALDKVGIFIQGKGKTYAPVRTGVLRESIHKEGPIVTRKNVRVEVGTNVFYAPYQEFGTSRGIKAKLYMTRATEEAKQQFPNYLKDAGVKIVSSLAQ